MSTSDPFPSAFLRYLLCIGCEPTILPPHRPDLKPFVERFQRTLQEECTRHHRPTTVQAANDVLTTFNAWYNHQRPHQGLGRQLQPPARGLPSPTARVRLPDKVDPDAWLTHYHRHLFRRQVDGRGGIQLWKHDYYVGQRYAGQRCTVSLEATARQLHVEVNGTAVKQLPVKGLFGQILPYDAFLGHMLDEARSEWKTYLWRQQHARFMAAAR